MCVILILSKCVKKSTDADQAPERRMEETAAANGCGSLSAETVSVLRELPDGLSCRRGGKKCARCPGDFGFARLALVKVNERPSPHPLGCGEGLCAFCFTAEFPAPRVPRSMPQRRSARSRRQSEIRVRPGTSRCRDTSRGRYRRSRCSHPAL